MTVYSLGHSNVDAYVQVRLLQRYQINVVVDVRSVPYSQYSPQFNRETFAATLARSNIVYKFAGDYLGGRPNDPTCYKSGKLPDEHADNYLELVDYARVMGRRWFLRAIARLEEVASQSRTVLMCSEEDPVRCHRHHLIAQTLLERGAIVQHIRGNGDLENAKFIAVKRVTVEQSFQQQTMPFEG